MQRDLQLAKHGGVHRAPSTQSLAIRSVGHGFRPRVTFGYPSAHTRAPPNELGGTSLSLTAQDAVASTSSPSSPSLSAPSTRSAAFEAALQLDAATNAIPRPRSPARAASPLTSAHPIAAPSSLAELATEVFTPRQASLNQWRSALDTTLAEAYHSREDARRAEQEATAELTRTVWPTQLSGLCARAIVLHVLKAATAVRVACERLEREADSAHALQVAEVQAQWQRAATSCEELDRERAIASRSLQNEITVLERDGAQALAAAEAEVQSSAARAQALLESERSRLGDEKRVVEDALRRAQHDHDERGRRLEAVEGELQEALAESSRSKRLWKAELAATQQQAEEALAAADDAHAAERAQLASELDRISRHRDELGAALEAERQAHADVAAQKAEMEGLMQREIGRVMALKAKEGERLQREINRLREVHELALREGTFGRGRQILYMDSLREPKKRANSAHEPPPSACAEAPAVVCAAVGGRASHTPSQAPFEVRAAPGVCAPPVRRHPISWRPPQYVAELARSSGVLGEEHERTMTAGATEGPAMSSRHSCSQWRVEDAHGFAAYKQEVGCTGTPPASPAWR